MADAEVSGEAVSVSVDPEGAETRAIHDLADFRGRAVLEVGCGFGRMTWRYAKEADSVLALDVSEDKIRVAVAHTPIGLRSTVTFKAADIIDADVPEDTFDVAILSHSL